LGALAIVVTWLALRLRTPSRDRAERWAARNGYGAVTLTTFRDVPWNLPFYARLGFDVVAPDEVSASLRAIVEDETRRGLDPSRRVVMKRPGPPQSDHLN